MNMVKIVLRVLAALMALLAIAVVCRESWRSTTDFPQYYAAGKLFLSGQAAKIYELNALYAIEYQYFPGMLKPVMFCFPPFAIPIFLLASLPPPLVAQYGWTIASLLCYGAAFVILKRAFAVDAWKLYFLGAVLCLSGPFAQAIIMGQPTFFLLLGLCLATIGLKRDVPVVAALGLLLMSPKTHLALPLVMYMLGAKKFKPILIAGAAGLVLLGATYLVGGSQLYTQYFTFIKYVNASPEAMNLPGCVTIRTQLFRYLPEFYAIISGIGIAVFAAGLVYLLYLGYRYRSHSRWLEIGTLVTMPLGFVTSVYVHPYDLLLFLPSIVVFSFAYVGRVPTGTRMALMAIVAFLLFVFPVYIEFYFTVWQFYPLFWAVLAYTAIVLANVNKSEVVKE